MRNFDQKLQKGEFKPKISENMNIFTEKSLCREGKHNNETILQYKMPPTLANLKLAGAR